MTFAIKIDSGCRNFLVDIPFHMNFLARDIPKRRFDRKLRVWKAPTTKLNAIYLQKKVEEGALCADDQVKFAINSKVEGKVPKPVGFPDWYRFKTEPYGLQKEALNLSYGLDVFAFLMEMGTGKSKVYTDLTSALHLEKKINGVIFLTKNSLKRNILNEFGIHSPLDNNGYLCHVPEFGSKAKDRRNKEAMDFEYLSVISAGVEGLSQGKKLYQYLIDFVATRLCAVIVDESHLIKGHRSVRTERAVNIGRGAKYRYIGTGTEILLGPLDLYAQFEFLDADIIGAGDYYSCRNRYAVMGGYEGKQITGYQNMDEFSEAVAPWSYQALKKDHLDIPKKIYQAPIEVELTKRQKEVYTSVKKEKLAILGDDIEVICTNVLTAYLALQQVCAGFITYDNEESGERSLEWLVEPNKNPKFKEALEWIEATGGKQVIIWSRFVPEVKALTAYLKTNGVEAECYYGGISQNERNSIEEDFKKGDFQVLAATQMSAGTGLTFTNSWFSLYMSNSFNLGDRLQSEDRNHRIGQKNSVTYGDIVAKGSVEMDIIKNLMNKVDIATYVRQQIGKGVRPMDLFG